VVTYDEIEFLESIWYDRVRASRYAADGQAVFTEEEVFTQTYGSGYHNRTLTAEADGDLLVVWAEWAEGGDLLGRRYPSAMPPGDDQFQISDRPEEYKAVAAFSCPSSPFVVAWVSTDCDAPPPSRCLYVRWFRSFPDVLVDGFESGDVSRWCMATP
jgi:hypothetical protein